jgi:hypothetical protein
MAEGQLLMENLIPHYYHWDGKVPKCIKSLIAWEEAGTFKLRIQSDPFLTNTL